MKTFSMGAHTSMQYTYMQRLLQCPHALCCLMGRASAKYRTSQSVYCQAMKHESANLLKAGGGGLSRNASLCGPLPLSSISGAFDSEAQVLKIHVVIDCCPISYTYLSIEETISLLQLATLSVSTTLTWLACISSKETCL